MLEDRLRKTSMRNFISTFLTTLRLHSTGVTTELRANRLYQPTVYTKEGALDYEQRCSERSALCAKSFIMDDAEQFLPLYLRFVRCNRPSDISLNVSREILQKDPVVDSMRAALTKRALDFLLNCAQKTRSIQRIFRIVLDRS